MRRNAGLLTIALCLVVVVPGLAQEAEPPDGLLGWLLGNLDPVGLLPPQPWSFSLTVPSAPDYSVALPGFHTYSLDTLRLSIKGRPLTVVLGEEQPSAGTVCVTPRGVLRFHESEKGATVAAEVEHTPCRVVIWVRPGPYEDMRKLVRKTLEAGLQKAGHVTIASQEVDAAVTVEDLEDRTYKASLSREVVRSADCAAVILAMPGLQAVMDGDGWHRGRGGVKITLWDANTGENLYDRIDEVEAQGNRLSSTGSVRKKLVVRSLRGFLQWLGAEPARGE
jgi:hypothetical protein